MDKEVLALEVRGIIEGYLKDKGFTLVELILRHEGRDLAVRILADRPEGGITVSECAYLNRELSQLIDERGLINQSYILEVSSPGIDRPLQKKEDFLRCTGKKVQIFLSEPVKEKWEWEGEINRIENDTVYINLVDEEIQVPLLKIRKAKQVIY